jgi:hypothetical protein
MRNRSCASAAKVSVVPPAPTVAVEEGQRQSVRLRKLTKSGLNRTPSLPAVDSRRSSQPIALKVLASPSYAQENARVRGMCRAA